MSLYFEELDFWPSPIGTVSLQRRRDLALNVDVFEIKLGDQYLMSSLFTVSEIALARLALAEQTGTALDVAVGGLGLGYTAKAVLEHHTVRSLIVVEMLEAVIEWHETGLLPLGPELTGDPRCRFIRGDFFALAGSELGFDPDAPKQRFHAILLDIDHSPEALLDERSTSFYQPEGLRRLAGHLHPGGIFALWSNDKPNADFTERMAYAFGQAWAEPVTFHNPLQDRPFTQTIYLGRMPGAPEM